MPNGRCRLHGGLSTGPKTETGKRRISSAAYRHGRYTEEAKLDRYYKTQSRRRIKAMLREASAWLRANVPKPKPIYVALTADGDWAEVHKVGRKWRFIHET